MHIHSEEKAIKLHNNNCDKNRINTKIELNREKELLESTIMFFINYVKCYSQRVPGHCYVSHQQ